MRKGIYKTTLIAALLSLFCTDSRAASSRGYPQTAISNGAITAIVGIETGQDENYYRGQRFDHSGVIYSLKYKGHEFFGEWWGKHFDPKFHHNICGPVDDFLPIGYDDANVGGEFAKIGVGILRRNSDKPYHFVNPFEIVDGGARVCAAGKNWIEYTHTLKSGIISYKYTKRIELVPDAPVMKISYKLTNTGKTRISTEQYCHNFFMIDGAKAGRDIALKLPLKPVGGENWKDVTRTATRVDADNVLRFTDAISEPHHVVYENYDGDPSADKNRFELSNLKTGATVKISGSRPMTRWTFFAWETTYCPEPFIKIDAAPGDTFEWQNTYEFGCRCAK